MGSINRRHFTLPDSLQITFKTEQTRRKVVGLDISFEKTAVCVLDCDGQPVWQGKVDSEPGTLIEKLSSWKDEIDMISAEQTLFLTEVCAKIFSFLTVGGRCG